MTGRFGQSLLRLRISRAIPARRRNSRTSASASPTISRNLQKQMRDAERDLASNQRPAASKLRDALGDLDSNDLENRIQRSADWLPPRYQSP